MVLFIGRGHRASFTVLPDNNETIPHNSNFTLKLPKRGQ